MKCGMFEGCLMKRVKLWQWMRQVFRVKWSLRAGFSEQRTSMPWPGCLTQEMEVQASVAKNGEAKGTVGQRGDSEAWQGWVKLEGLVPTSHTSCSPAAAASAQKMPQMLSISQLSYVRQGGCCMRTGRDGLFLLRTPLGAPERLFLRFSVACFHPCCCHSVPKSCLTLWPHGLQHARLSCHSLSLRVCSNLCMLSQWCYQTISSSVTSFSSCLQSFPASESFPMGWLFISGGQSEGGASASVSVLPMNIHGWFPLGLTGLLSLQSKGLSGVFSNTTAWKHQFFGTQPSLWSNSHILTWLLEKP